MTVQRKLRLGRVCAVLCLILAAGHSTAQGLILRADRMQDWRARSFVGETKYEMSELDGIASLSATANASASGLYYEREISLHEWPLLSWRWQVKNTLKGKNERTRDGDDFAARIYVVSSHPLFFWKTRAICYVWASQAQAGQDWPNPYTENVHMVALNGVGDSLGQWQSHTRNIADDFKRYFDAEPDSIEAVAVMTDSDQAGVSVSARYADIRFAAE